MHATIARMTDERQSAIERAIAYGIDVSLLRANLRLTPTERLRRGEAYMLAAVALREQGHLAREKKFRDDAQALRDAADDAG
jgi:hypothetical protein